MSRSCRPSCRPCRSSEAADPDVDEDPQLGVDLVEDPGLSELVPGLRIGGPEHDDQTTVLPEEIEELADELSTQLLVVELRSEPGAPLLVEALDELDERRRRAPRERDRPWNPSSGTSASRRRRPVRRSPSCWCRRTPGWRRAPVPLREAVDGVRLAAVASLASRSRRWGRSCLPALGRAGPLARRSSYPLLTLADACRLSRSRRAAPASSLSS